MTPMEHLRTDTAAEIRAAHHEISMLQAAHDRAELAARSPRHPVRWNDYVSALEQARDLSLLAVQIARRRTQFLERVASITKELA